MSKLSFCPSSISSPLFLHLVCHKLRSRIGSVRLHPVVLLLRMVQVAIEIDHSIPCSHGWAGWMHNVQSLQIPPHRLVFLPIRIRSLLTLRKCPRESHIPRFTTCFGEQRFILSSMLACDDLRVHPSVAPLHCISCFLALHSSAPFCTKHSCMESKISPTRCTSIVFEMEKLVEVNYNC